MSEVLKVNNTYTTFDGYPVTIKMKYANLFLAEVEIDDNVYQVAYSGDGECVTYPNNIGFSGPEFDIVIEPEDISTEDCQEECCDNDCEESCDEICSSDSSNDRCCCKESNREIIKHVCYQMVGNLSEMFNDITKQIKIDPSNKTYWNAYNSILSNLFMWTSKIEQLDR